MSESNVTQATGKLTLDGMMEALEKLLYDHEETDVVFTGPWFTGIREYLPVEMPVQEQEQGGKA